MPKQTKNKPLFLFLFLSREYASNPRALSHSKKKGSRERNHFTRDSCWDSKALWNMYSITRCNREVLHRQRWWESERRWCCGQLLTLIFKICYNRCKQSLLYLEYIKTSWRSTQMLHWICQFSSELEGVFGSFSTSCPLPLRIRVFPLLHQRCKGQRSAFISQKRSQFLPCKRQKFHNLHPPHAPTLTPSPQESFWY